MSPVTNGYNFLRTLFVIIIYNSISNYFNSYIFEDMDLKLFISDLLRFALGVYRPTLHIHGVHKICIYIRLIFRIIMRIHILGYSVCDTFYVEA